MPILCKDSNKIYADAIFLQPTRYCSWSCSDCYVQNHCKTDFQTSWREQVRLLSILKDSSQVKCKQVTLSVDSIPEIFLQGIHLREVFHEFCNLNLNSEQHITVRNLDEFLIYEGPGTNFNNLDLISFSDISLRDWRYYYKYIQNTNTQIGWNLMVPSKKVDEKKFLKEVEEKIKLVDQVYLLLNKSTIGGPRSSKENQTMAWNLYYMKKIQEIGGNKIVLDGCLQDILKCRDTGFGCSANISKFQIWPDGSVTGCPYKYKSQTNIGRTAEDILENIKAAQNHYDFNECHLLEVLNSVGVF